MGKNINSISRDCNLSFKELTSRRVKTTMRYAAMPEAESWRVKTTMRYAAMPEAESLRVNLIREIIDNEATVPLSSDEKEDILHFACTS